MSGDEQRDALSERHRREIEFKPGGGFKMGPEDILAICAGLCALLLVIGWAAYGASIPGHTVPALLVTLVLGSTVFCCLGFALASIIRNADAAQPVVQAVVLPLYFISGVFVSTSLLPRWLSDVAEVFPVRHLASALLATYNPHTVGSGFHAEDLGVLAAWGVALMAVVMLTASALDAPLGWPALLAAMALLVAIAVRKQEAPWQVLGHLSWSILPLVAGLFVIVEGLRHAGLLDLLTRFLQEADAARPGATAALAGVGVAVVCNLMNNLPAGLIAGSVVHAANVGTLTQGAVLVGVDLGPNLSVTGSLATILWLLAIKRQGEHVSAWTFLKTGAIAMPVALGGALLALWV